MHRLYENNDIAVFWDSDKCYRAKRCVTGSPSTFNKERRPWIDLSIAPNEEIWQTIEKCPSGALGVVYKHGIDVIMDEENNRSLAYDGDKQVGECDYEENESGRIIYHTEVIPGYEGKGIAKRLVYKVLEAADKKGVKIDATCSYAKKIITE